MIVDICDNAQCTNSVAPVGVTPTASIDPIVPTASNRNLTFYNNTRYVILMLSMLALSLILSNTLALNFTRLCMVKEIAPETITANGVHNNATVIEMFTKTEGEVLCGVVAIGTFIGCMLITKLLTLFGFRKVFVLFGMMNAFATMATPLATLVGVVFVALMRVIQGVALSTGMVALGAISAEWSTVKATGTFIACLSCYLQFGPIIVLPLAGVMCETWGWHWLYYILGVVSFITFTLFFYFYRDSPRLQKNVSRHELNNIEKGKQFVITTKSHHQIIPYRAILLDPFTWGFLSTMGAGIFSINLICQFGYVYLNKVLGMKVKNTGLMAAMPFILSAIVKIIGGPLSDCLTCLSEKARVIMFASVSQFLMAACYIALAFLSIKKLELIQGCFTLVVVFSGLNAVGAVTGAHLATKNFCHVLMAWAGLQYSISTLILPILVGAFAPDNTAQQWGNLFLLISVIVIVTNIFFIMTYTRVPRPYVIASTAGENGDITKK